jgi:putative hemolysin
MKRILISIAIGLGAIALMIIGAGIYKFNFTNSDIVITCPQDGRVCNDGTVVERIAPLCEFATCPAEAIKAEATSTVSTSTSGLANPASTNCVKQGGTSKIQTKPDGSQYGLCYFEENRACEEWALMRGDCPVGGRKTTGFDTIDQNFCAWSGGETYAVKNSVCTFKNGSKCPTIDFYNGKCQPSK